MRTQLNPLDSSWDDLLIGEAPRARLVSVLRYKDERLGYYFCFDEHGNQRNSRYSPGQNERVHEIGGQTWDQQVQSVGHWLAYLRRELGEPDSWQAWSKDQGGLPPEIREIAGNELFTAQEVGHILQAIEKVKVVLLPKIELTQVQQQTIEHELDYLVDVAKRQSRRDFINIAMGAIAGLVLNRVIPSDVATQMWNILGPALYEIYKLLTR